MSTKATGRQKNTAVPQPLSVNTGGESRGRTLKNFLSKLETDDYILAGILIVLIREGCDDYVLLAVLGYLFIVGLKDVG